MNIPEGLFKAYDIRGIYRDLPSDQLEAQEINDDLGKSNT